MISTLNRVYQERYNLRTVLLIITVLFLAGCGNTSSTPNFQTKLAQAQGYLSNGQIQATLIEGRNLLRAKPGDAQALQLMGDAFFVAGDIQSALTHYEKAYGDLKGNPEFIFQYLETLIKLGRFEQAKTVIQQSSIDPQNPQILQFQGDIAFLKNNIDQAEQFYQQSLDKAPQTSGSLLGLARVSSVKGNSSKTIDWLNQANESRLDYVDALLFEGQYHLREKDPAQAEAAFSNALAALGKYDVMTSQKYRALQGLSKAFMDQGRTDAALQLNRRLADSPQGKIHKNLASAMEAYEQGDSAKAKESLERILEIAPGHKMGNLSLGLLKLEEGDISEAEHLLTQASDDIKSLNEKTIQALVLARLQLNKFDSAQQALNEGLTVYPDNIPLKLLQASLLVEQKAYEQALQQLNDLAQSNPDNSDVYHLRATALSALQQAEAAQKDFKKVIELRPDFFPAYRGLIMTYPPREALKQIQSIAQTQKTIASELALGIAHFANQDFQSARSLGQKLLKQAPDSPLIQRLTASSLLGLAQNNYNNGQVDIAYAQAKDAIKVLPSQYSATFLAKLAVELQRADEAIEILKAIVKDNPTFSPGYELLGDLESASDEHQTSLSYYKQAWDIQPNFHLGLKLFRAQKVNQSLENAMSHLHVWHKKNQIAYERESADGQTPSKITSNQYEQSLFALSNVYEQNDQPVKAIGYYEQLVKIRPRLPVYLNNLAWLKFSQGQSGAVEYARQAYELAPETGEIIDTYAWILVQQGELDEGIRLLELAKQKSPTNTMIQQHFEQANALKSKSI